MMNKRGVSPLIATVLLIAFAVSLGAVVMNWTSAELEIASSGGSSLCSDVSVQVLNKGSGKAICLDRDARKIIIDIENGPVRIDGFRLSYLSSVSDFIDFRRRIEAGVLSKVELDYDPVLYGELRNVKIVPIVRDSAGSEVYCTTKSLSFSIIDDC